VSPRKSSTSSGKRPARRRPRYLGIEVAGEPFPPPSLRWWETTLRRALDASSAPGAFRIVRAEGYRAIVEVDQWWASAAREAWTCRSAIPGESVELRTRRTWGTLRGAKVWLRAAR
jgi:RNase P/RNase MRP subunit POP5